MRAKGFGIGAGSEITRDLVVRIGAGRSITTVLVVSIGRVGRLHLFW